MQSLDMGMLLAFPGCFMDMAVIKAVSEEARLKIMEKLRCGGVCSCKLPCYACVSQPATSQHLKILLNAGLVKVTKKGKHRVYSLTEKGSRVLNDIKGW